ncbi:unnamed protein product [Caenorhabditis nigoni]
MPPFIYGEEENLSDEEPVDEVPDPDNALTQEQRLRPENDREVQIRIRIKCQELYVSILGFFRENTQEYWEAEKPRYDALLQDLQDDARLNLV